MAAPNYFAKKQSPEEQDLVSDLIRDWEYMYGLRGNWDNHWTEIAQRILPMDSYLFQNFSQLNSEGDKRNLQLFDSTGLVALQRFAAILDSLLTPADQYWHHLRANDETLMRNREVRFWFDKANEILWKQRYAPTSNFQAQNSRVFTSLGAYGTGLMFVDQLAGLPGIRYKNTHLSECYVRENHQGVVDGVCRHFMLKAYQAYKQFGDKCPENITEVMDQFPERKFYFLHWVKERTDRDPGRRDFKGMKFAEYYVSIEGHALVEEGGYHSFPYAVPRYYQATNETYGRSPAMDVLPAIKTLNEQKKTMLKQGHRALDPILIAHDDGVIDGMDLTPGALNFGGVTKDGRPLVQALPIGSIQAGKEIMDDERNLINDTFLVSLFQILTESPEMTATEVMERVREKGILLAPTIGRQNSEYLGPMIHRELDLLAKQGLLPPMPPLLRQAEGEYKIVYDSPIVRTQKSEWASGAMRTLQNVLEVVKNTGNTSLLNYINWDMAIPQMAAIYGTPSTWINTQEQVNQLKMAQAQQAQQQQQIQAAPAVAGIMKSLPQPSQNAGPIGQG